VVHEPHVGAGPAQRERRAQRVEHEVCAHVRRQLPARDDAREGVEHEREEQPALPAGQVGQIGHPQRVRARRGEVAAHEVLRALGVCGGLGRRPRPAAALGALDARAAHQTRHLIAPDVALART